MTEPPTGQQLDLLPVRLKIRRAARQISQAELARRLNVSPATVALYETGDRKPAPGMLRALALTLDCSTDFLLGLTEDSRPSHLEVTAASRGDDPLHDLPDEAIRQVASCGGNKKRGGLSACPSLLSPGRSPASSAGDARLSLLVWLQAAGFPSPNG